jgi:hypothetical protein
MNRYRYEIALTVEVDAFDLFDADEIVADTFGEGESAGAKVVSMTVVDVSDT